MKKKTSNDMMVAIGILLLMSGFALLKLNSELQGIMLVLPYICIGLGCGAFGHGCGNIVSHRVMKEYPQIEKQIKIEKNDERNIAISNQAKAKAYDIMVYVFGALMVSLGLMSVDVKVILLLVFAYLFVVGSSIYYLEKYSKEM